MTKDFIWIGIGLLGQFLFGMRFLVQWITSERRRQSVIPIVFWYFSLGGGIILLSYALYRQDIVFIVGQSLGLIVYSRNLYFIKKSKEPSFLRTEIRCLPDEPGFEVSSNKEE